MEESKEERMEEIFEEKAEPAAIPAANKEEIKQSAIEVVKKFLFGLGVRAKLEIRDEASGGLYINIRLRAMAGFLIGRQGATLRALQHLVAEILLKKYPNLPPITLDVSGYRMRRINFLKKKALAVARVVMDTKREMALDFLTPRELKIVADALAELKEVKIYAIGSGVKRNVIIAPNR